MTELSLRRQRWVALAGVYALAATLGVWSPLALAGPWTKSNVGAMYLLIVALMSLGFLWLCIVDARLLSKPLMWSAKMGIFFGWPVGMPVYILWSRGIGAIGLLLSHGILFSIVVGMSMIAGCIVAFFCFGDPFAS